MTGVVTAHHAAVLALLADLPMTLHDGQVPEKLTTASYPYAVLYVDTGIDEATKLCGDPDQTTYRFQLTSVGLTTVSALIVVDQTRQRLLGARPVVAGQALGRIRKEAVIPVRPDRDVTLPDSDLHPMFAVDTYVVESWKD